MGWYMYWCCVGHGVKCPVLIAFPLKLNFPVNIDIRFVLQSYIVILPSVRLVSQCIIATTVRNSMVILKSMQNLLVL